MRCAGYSGPQVASWGPAVFVGPEAAWASPLLLCLGFSVSASASDPQLFLFHFLPFSSTTAISAFPPLQKFLSLHLLIWVILVGSHSWAQLPPAYTNVLGTVSDQGSPEPLFGTLGFVQN